MDTIQDKINVIHWLTEYKGQICSNAKSLMVELIHPKRMYKCVFTAPNEGCMLDKLNGFITAKLSTNSVDKLVFKAVTH